MAPHRKGLLSFEGVRIKPGSTLIAFLESVCNGHDCEEDLRKKAEDFLKCDATGIPFGPLRSLREAVNAAGVGAPVYLHKLLEGSELCLPSPVTPPRNPELEARVQKLKAQQLNRDYDRMTSDVDVCRARSSLFTKVGAEVRQVKQQSWALVNLLVTVAGTFAFFYKAVEYSLPDPHIPLQVLVALIASIVVAVAELYFLIRVI
ncbi:transmembrane protein 199 [Dermacentor albipictus]|uniref:transmembrane protein 199 n=1 Tax=Dermacentor albipictus TaxID=60249 RepID=UPI0038FCB618